MINFGPEVAHNYAVRMFPLGLVGERGLKKSVERFDSMLTGRDFRVVIVRPSTACGLDNESSDLTVHYNGSLVTVRL